MNTQNRIINHPILGSLNDRKQITFTFNGEIIEAFEGETVAAALLANRIRTIRFHEESGTPRGIYCNIGHCYECRVTIDGMSGLRSCLTLVRQGIKVESGQKLPTPFKKDVCTNV